MTDMTAAQAAQQNNRDGAGKYSTKQHAPVEGIDLSGGTPPFRFNVAEGACLAVPGQHPVGVRVTNDPGLEFDYVTVRMPSGSVRDVPRDQLVSGRIQTVLKPPSEIEKYDLVVVDGTIYEVCTVDNDHKSTSLDLDGYDNYDEDGSSYDEDDEDASSIVSFKNDEMVETIDSRLVDQNVGLALDPQAISDAEFEERFTAVLTPEGDTCFEEPPAGTPEDRVWTQVMGQLDDGREVFQLVPGYSSDAINYVVTEKSWSDDDVPADIRVCWD